MKVKSYAITLITGLTGFFCQKAMAQTQPGFVQQDVMKIAGITTAYQADTLNRNNKLTTRAYYDGLGRTLQSVAMQASPLQNDLIQPVVYDNLGRQTTGYLPYAGLATDSAGSYRGNAISTGQPNFYNQTSQHLIAVDVAPYNQQVFENSPLQRLLSAGMVGTGYQPGVSGAHFKTVSYRPNNSTSDGSILIWNPDGTYSGNSYANNTLSVTDGKDEDNTETLTFTDLEGHVILKRQILTGGNLDTYYIYNNAGMVSYVVPPLATAKLAANSYNLTIAPLSNLVFHFMYDTMGRLVQKTVPAKGVMYIVYDPMNRPVLMQDANMRVNNQWNYIKYDAKGRAISQGIYTDVTHNTLALMQTYVSGLSYVTWYELRSSGGTTTGYYTNNVFPTTGTALAYAYYDDYDLLDNGTPYTYITQSLPGEIGATTAQVKGMPTMVWKTTVGAGLSGTWLLKATFYDKRLNPIQTRSNNHLYYLASNTLTDIATTVPNFNGIQQISKVSKQTGASTTTVVQSNFTYDLSYRITAISQQYNGGAAIPTAAYTYNEIGQVVAKNLGQVATGTIPANVTLTTYSATTVVASNSITLNPTFTVPSGSPFKAIITSATGYLQTLDYRYNIRGQLLNINNSKLSNDGGVTNSDNNDLFGMQFLYDNVDSNLGNTAYFNGKLSAVKWMSKDANGNSSYERAFRYNYDILNRDTAAIYAERTTAGTGSFTVTHGWDENRITYDQNGNLLTLFRMEATQGAGNHIPIDNLSYTYSTSNPNQLQSVADATGNAAGFMPGTGTGNYTYDGNGNLTADPYKGLTKITYNVLNRTDSIKISGTQYITYTYDATGSLIRKQAYKTGTTTQITDYIDGFVYNNTSGTEALAYFPMPEGRVINNAGTLVQEFIITDQQGNARLSFQNNGSGTAIVKQENSYYAFGLIMPGTAVTTPATPNKNLYNGGSEWQNDYSNLPDYYQTFNRNYDAATGRFVGVDPAAEGAESMSSYQYSGNNPIMYNDPLGDLKRVGLAPIPMGGNNGEFSEEIDQYREQQFNDLFGTGFGGLPGSIASATIGSGNGSSGTGLSADQVAAISALYNDRINTIGRGNYYFFDHSGTYMIDRKLSLLIAASNLNQFGAWGTNGFSPSFDAAIYSYDMNPNRKGPALTLSGEEYNFTPPGANGNGGQFFDGMDANGNLLVANGMSGYDELAEVKVYGNPEKEIDYLGILDRAGTYTEATAFAAKNSGLLEFAGENALKAIGNGVGLFVIGDDVIKSYKAFKAGDWKEGTWQAIKAGGTGAFMYFGGAEYQGAKLLWNLGSLIIDDARGQ